LSLEEGFVSTIVVRNFPEDLHDRLKERAERNRRSMTKEVVHLIEAGLGSEPPPTQRPLPSRVSLNSDRVAAIEETQPTAADFSTRSAPPPDGRAALRAALIKQPDGSYVNVLGIEDNAFFDALDRIRAEAQAPDVSKMFDDSL